MYASGSRFISGSGGNIAARDSVRRSWSVVVDVLNKGLEAGLPETTILNTTEGIRATSLLQYPQLYLSGSEVDLTPTLQNVEEVQSDFKLVSAIVESGTSNFPTLLARSSNKGYGFESPYNILGAPQITSPLASASSETLNDISESFGAILSIFANGTGSFNFVPNTKNAIKVTELEPTPISTAVSNSITASVSSSFQTVISIINSGVSAVTRITSSNEAAIKVSDLEQFTTGISSSLQTINRVSASFSIIYNILDKGTGSVRLPIPQDHIRDYIITNNGSSSYEWEGIGSNPTITLYRGETYKLYVSASNVFGGINYPFFIRTQPLSGISEKFDYDNGVINNGDSVGNITFTVPYDAPNELYYVAQNTDAMSGKFHIINNSATPFDLIVNTLTYPQTISGSVTASNNIDILNAYELLTENKSFIEEETIQFVNSSWSDFEYDEATCRRDIGFLIDAVADDLLFGGNNNSITAGRFYYEYPSTATTTQKDPTKTAVKYVAGMAQKLLKDVTFVEPTNERDAVANVIKANREFIQNETITFLSSSWSNFYYNEAKCKRDVGYILDAVATDALYGGNERSVQAGQFYYLYPSLAIVDGDGDSEGQLGQTLDGIRFAAGNTVNIVAGIAHQTASLEIRESYRLLRENKQLIQNETIEFINVAFPQLKYNTETCRRDVGYIIDAISTDLLYGGIERSVTAGRYYYEYPSQATRTQRRETSGGIRYSKIISDFIVQNIILETPRIITNDERLLKVTNLTNTTSSFSGTITEQNSISSSFAIIEGIIKRGTNVVPSILAQNNGQNWNINNPINVSGLTQITSATSSANLTSSINDKFAIVTKIIDSGSLVAPAITASIEGLVKITGIEQITGSAGTQLEANLISSSFATIARIITNGTGSIPSFIPNTISAIKVTDAQQWTGSSASNVQSTFVSSSIVTITNIIENGLDVVPTLVPNTSQSIKVTNVPQISSSLYFASASDVSFISQSISFVSNIIEFGTGSVVTASLYTNATTSSNIIGVYNLLKQNIPFIQAETIAYLSSSWQGFEFNDISCSRDIGLIISGAAEDLYWNTNSSSIVNGKYYLEFPSAATSSQLNQTLDGIKYASRIAQKIIQNVKFIKPSSDVINASTQLLNNKHFIQSESIAYLSSSWGEFEYNDQTCKRDVGYIVDAVRTDLVYGGNERSITAGEYYYLYPSDATGSQLIQTLDGINYASRVAQNIVSGTLYQTASLEKQNADFLLNKNKQLISNEVVEYVSSSWFSIPYNETKCKRDVRYIIDAVRTDLIYGGNERSRLAGEFYYKFPSSATVGGVPSVTNQLDPTITGIEYGNQFAQKIVLGNIFTTASNEALNVNKILQQNRNLIKAETIQYISAFYPYLVYNEASCSRDVGFILDGISTDILYGGNERSVIAGTYYYKFPSVATSNSQKRETIDSINYFRNIVKNIVSNEIIDNSEFVSNTDGNIKVGNVEQITSSLSATNVEVSNISSSFATVTQIIEGGLVSIPTIVSNNEGLIKVTSETQIISAVSASSVEVGVVTASFGLIRDIIYWGSASLPDSLASNFQYGFEKEEPTLLRISSFVQTTGSGEYNEQTSSVSSSFGNIINVINNGTDVIPSLEANTSASINVSGIIPFTSTISGSNYEPNRIGNLFGVVMNIIEGGRNSIPTLIGNTSASIKVTNTPQIISGSGADRLQARLVSSSFGIVMDSLLNNGTSSVSYVGPSGINTNPKITTAYNLLLDNQQFIIDETISYMSSSWSTFDYNQTKCERDLGLIISGAAFDLLWGGNSASLVNGKFYFESASQANSTQLDQTLTAIGYAGRIAARVVRNTPLVHITASLETSASYTSLIKNKGFIQSESISYVSSSWQGFEYNEASCSRDIGFIVDAVATDLLYGGNERSIIAGRYYYDFPSQATNVQLEQTLTGVRYAKGTAMNVVVNKQFFAPNTDNQTAYNLIKDNKEFVQEETVAFVNAKYPELDYIESKCKRDVGFIVDAVATDLLYGGNERSNKAGEFYYLYPSLATENEQVVETTTAVDYARRLTQEVINSNVIPTPQIIPNSGVASTDPNVLATYDLLIDNKPFIQAETIEYVSSSWFGFEYDDIKCKRDVGFLIDAVATDLLYGGNESSANAGVVYYLTASQATGLQLEPTVDAIDYAGGLASKVIQSLTFVTASQIVTASVNLLRNNREFIQEETMAYLTASWSTFDYDKVKCRRDVGYIVDGVATDLLYGGNERSAMSGEFYYRYPSEATTTQVTQTNEGINFASRVAQKVVQNIVFQSASLEASASFDLLRKNKSFIQAEGIAYVSSSWSTVYYNEASCSRDIGFLVDAAATDVLYGGQERAVTAGTYYFLFPSKATVAGVPSEANQLDPTITGVKYAGRLATKVVINPTYTQASGSAIGGSRLLQLNKSLIQRETITFLSSSWSTLQYNEISCSRDVGFIIDAVRTDLVYGGNERSIEAGSYYYKIPSVAIKESYTDNGGVGQKKQTVDGVNYAGGVSEKIVAQIQLVRPGQRRIDATNRLRGAKEELKQRAIGYTNGAFPYLVYNEASCSRDTGLIVDACATDLFYGGNERGIAAASSYFNGQFGNADEVIFKQRLETLETNRYLRTKAEFVAAGAPLESFGSLIVATGIDYSYNGSGVTFKALPPNQGGSGVPNPDFEITELGGGRIFFTSGNQDGDFRIGTGLSINQATGTLVGRTFSKSLFSLVTPFSLALQI
jgi:hypothetical protein